ncbi:Uncharacterized protein ALO70_03148 [Pseudomonas amygdali pv. eriobotryae]|uniref:Uncharacterized protein n=1 Tax=Pseudomonas amygdali pv. eriobotryae TaxID=129137 RepID=A0A0N8RJK0_PSEA0|nr:hypothetical protein [Pseudomonas amygdali]KPX34607.1 Uncharacterized protein ALO70_03148 [Pseudomonas amygdali pv. eriobotryae]KWS78953.1 hypothetical protein AL052_27620 [Pseudomonas amygdali pv. eriobotryae]RML96537.1 hypothetical protein ALQ86_200097 [Pseudomonas amygdali pv. eriobotryae]RMO54298.1 hypothetical protein ALQ39_05773 [Pseudomonas amygdali pv. eriobotryae]
MRATDVFKPKGIPTHTLVREPVAPAASISFDDAIEEGGTLIRVVGPSKSGKTVFVDTKAEARRYIRISASGLKNALELWTRVLASAGGEAERTTSTEFKGTVGGEAGAKASAGIVLFKAETEGKVKADVSASSSTAIVLATDPLHTVIQMFQDGAVWIFIDDFHYATADVRKELAEQIKFAAEEGVQLIIALIPGRSEDLLQKNGDLQGRIVDISFDYWNDDELSSIAHSGFPHLNIRLEPGSSVRLARESAGTPQLMQAICLELARELGARETLTTPITCTVEQDQVATICRRLANGADFSETIEQIRKGPPERGNPRKSYTDATGKTRDVYELIIDAIAIDPPQLKFTYTDLQNRVNLLAGEPVASVWESVRHISAIANNMGAEKKFDFGGDLRWVSILDPYLFFALRWS